MSIANTSPSPAKLRWYQFRLRTLLLLFVLVAIACAACERLRRRLGEREAARVFQEHGATIYYDEGGERRVGLPFTTRREWLLNNQHVSELDFRQQSLDELLLFYAQTEKVTRKDAAELDWSLLQSLPAVKRLNLS